jgi:hypothetical protein
LIDGIEKYILNCPKGISDEKAKIITDRILTQPNIRPYLTEWIGGIVSLPNVLGGQNTAAQNAIAVIDAELVRRQ